MKYTAEFLKVAKQAAMNGFNTEKIKRIKEHNFFEKELNSKEPKGKFLQSVQQLHSEVWGENNYYKRVALYLQKLGLGDKKPYQVLYSRKETIDPILTITLMVVNHDDSTEELEFAANGCRTATELVEAFEKINKGCGKRVVGSYDLCVKKGTRYYYDYIHTEYVVEYIKSDKVQKQKKRRWFKCLRKIF